jgi:hypothetical protein
MMFDRIWFYDVRQIALWNGMEWNGMEWNGMEWKCFSHDNTVLFHIITSTVHLHSLRFAGLFLRRTMPRSLLFTPLVYSLREIGFIMFDRFWVLWCSRDCFIEWNGMEWNGNDSHTIILFSSIITSTVHLHSLRFAGLFLRPADASVSTFYPFGFFSPRDWIYNVDISWGNY